MSNTLTVSINSFSYKRGIPNDLTGNGGGFVFDCRSVHNPGQYEEFKLLNGLDKYVIGFFEDEPEMHEYLRHTFAIIDQSVKKYIKNEFLHLMVNFGCTGGQHRSVYCAEQLALHLKNKYNINIVLKHIEQDLLKAK